MDFSFQKYKDYADIRSFCRNEHQSTVGALDFKRFLWLYIQNLKR